MDQDDLKKQINSLDKEIENSRKLIICSNHKFLRKEVGFYVCQNCGGVISDVAYDWYKKGWRDAVKVLNNRLLNLENFE